MGGGGTAVGGKVILERSVARRLMDCNRQSERLATQIEQTQAERGQLDAQTPLGAGSPAARLAVAEQQLEELQQLVPLQAGRHAVEQELATPRLSANMREPQEVESLRPPKSPLLAVFSRKAAEFNEASLVLVQIEPELRKSFAECVLEALGFNSILEANHEIVRKAYDDDVTVSLRSAPVVGP